MHTNIKKKFPLWSIQLQLMLLLVGSANAQSNSGILNLVPWPQEVRTKNQGRLYVDENFTIQLQNQVMSPRIKLATTKFLRRLAGRTGIFIDNGFAQLATTLPNAQMEINYDRQGRLELFEDESYTLEINSQKIRLEASTDIGIVRGIETLLQLLHREEDRFYFPSHQIEDAPRFPWRGLMIDVSRHFYPVQVLKRNLDAMAAFKMNVFHWHLTDDQGFRVDIHSRPKFRELASDGQYYTQEQIREVVAYASDLGIRVVPEIDIPGHATSWLVAYPEMASKDTIYTLERFAGIFDPTLNPIKPITYEILKDVIDELVPLFPDKYFHIGGDENEGKHWNENKEIQRFMKKNNIKDNHEMQAYFNLKVLKMLQNHNKIMMGWDEIMVPSLPKDVVIHSWRGIENMEKAAQSGYKTILSKGYYIDLMHSMQKHYQNDPMGDKHSVLSEEEKKNILGGEATMWSELVTPQTIDSRIWPRTAAIAERLWSAKEIDDYLNMRHRLEPNNQYLEELGITHIRNRDVILRNVTAYQDITSLITLSKVCEPLKAYTRNKGGIEYKSFSPFARFVDACNVDAIDAIGFNTAAKAYSKSKKDTDKQKLLQYLQLWQENNLRMQQLEVTNMLKPLLPLSANLAKTALLLQKQLQNNTISNKEKKDLQQLLQTLKMAVDDIELACLPGLEMLANQLKTN